MELKIRGDKIKITQSMKDYIEEKLSKLDKYLEKSNDVCANVMVKVRGHEQKVEITIPNEKIRGNYSLEIEKVDSLNPDMKIKGATFEVKANSQDPKQYGPTSDDGKIIVADKAEIESTQMDEYTISEVLLTDNTYIALAESFNVYVRKASHA